MICFSPQMSQMSTDIFIEMNVSGRTCSTLEHEKKYRAQVLNYDKKTRPTTGHAAG